MSTAPARGVPAPRAPLLVVWGVLTAATVVSWLLGHDGPTLGALTGAVVLLVAVVKVRLVGTWFMELRCAPRVLRRLFDGWCALLAATLVGLYLLL